MSWRQKVYSALNAEKMFENTGHSTRFAELLDCFGDYPFFTKGLCKCVYLSSWDEEHFCIMLETLTDLSLGKETSTDEMRAKGDSLVEEQVDAQYYVYLLSLRFLEDKPFILPEDAALPESFQYIIDCALKAAAIIDSL